MYHYLGDPNAPEDFPYWVAVDEFQKQMKFLQTRGFQTINLQQLADHIFEKKTIPRRSVVLTFDDGQLSFYEYAYPVLKMHGFTATMFLITSRIGQENYMDWKQIVEMQRDGFSFESHSLTHPILTKIDSAQAKKEISYSKEMLEKKLTTPIRFFAYRGGHYNDQIKEYVKQAGYHAAVCSRYGYNNNESDRYALYRIPVRRSDTLLSFSAKSYGLNPQRKISRIAARYLLR